MSNEIFLPPYSPQLNAINNFSFNGIKKENVQNIKFLNVTTMQSYNEITSMDYLAYFMLMRKFDLNSWEEKIFKIILVSSFECKTSLNLIYKFKNAFSIAIM